MTDTYRMARLYVQHCGFSVVPQWYRQKSLLFEGTEFQRRPPTLEHLQKWFVGAPRNLAIVPGEISDNLAILDFDDFGTWAVFHALTGYGGPVVRTGRGVHVYVRVKDLPERNGQGFFEDIHFGQIIVRGSITAPPSVHPSGKTYHWHGSPERIPYLRDLADIGVDRRVTSEPTEQRARPLPTPGQALKHGIQRPDAYVSAAINGECQKILSAAPGTRNQVVYTAALKLSKYAAMMPAATIAGYLESAALQAGLSVKESADAIRKGLSTGLPHGVLQAR